MKNNELVFNYENEIQGYFNNNIGQTTIYFTNNHLKTLSYSLLRNPWQTLHIEVIDALHFFGKTVTHNDFCEAWNFEYDRIQSEFSIKNEFEPNVVVPFENEKCFDFWHSLSQESHPIYYVSAIKAAWSIEGWEKVVIKMAKYWKEKKETPFFKFTTVAESKMDRFELPILDLRFFPNYLVTGNYRGFGYLKSLPNASPDFIQNFNSSININQPELCLN